MTIRMWAIATAVLLFAAGPVAAQSMQLEQTGLSTQSRFPLVDDVLYDQTDQASGHATPDQLFESGYAAYNCGGADDFEVSDPKGWEVDGVNTQGAGGGSTHVDITFHADAGGKPDPENILCEFRGTASYEDDAGDLWITLPRLCTLKTGRYWVAQAVRQDSGSAGSHFWANRLTANHSAGVWRNPGDGFGTGCREWTPQTACGVGGGTYPDYLFQILGSPTGTHDANTRSPFDFGPLGLGLVLLLGAGLGYLIARRRAPSS